MQTVSGCSLIDFTKPEKYVPSRIADFFAGKNTHTFLSVSIGLFVFVALWLPSIVSIAPIPESKNINGNETINVDVEIRKMAPDFTIVKINKTILIAVFTNVKCLTVFTILE